MKKSDKIDNLVSLPGTGELLLDTTVANFATVQKEGTRGGMASYLIFIKKIDLC